MSRARNCWYLTVLGLALAACASDPGPSGPRDEALPDPVGGALPAGLALSSPVPMTRPSSTVGGEVVYVAAFPGTRTGAVRASIANLTTGARSAAAAVDGGFDPVAVPATEGDSLRVVLSDSAGTSMPLLGAVFRPRPPRVVRTSPAQGRTDTPLNVRVTVVFSAPIVPASAATNVRLITAAGAAVPGRFEPVGPDLVAYEFAPTGGQLSPATAYRLEVAAELQDVLGQRIGEAVAVGFATAGTSPATGDVQRISLEPSFGVYFRPVLPGEQVVVWGTAFDSRDASVSVDFRFELSDSAVVQLVRQERALVELRAVAPGRAHVIGRAAGLVDTFGLIVASDVSPAEFASRRLLFSEGGQLVTMNGDGSDRVVLSTPTAAYQPSSGPDARIIYSTGRPTRRGAASPIDGEGALFIREPDGSIARFGEGDGETCPRWSPDGSRVASTRARTAELVVRLRDGTVERIVPRAGVTECSHWTPDGQRFFTGEDQVTPTGRYWWAGGVGPVAPDAQRVLIPEAWRIAEVDALANRSYPPMFEWTLGLPSTDGSYGSWSPDGEALAIAVWTSPTTESLWMVAGDGVRRAAVPGVGRVEGVQVLR